jgi:hypothetical protein
MAPSNHIRKRSVSPRWRSSDRDATVTVAAGDIRDLYWRLFRRSDGKQALHLRQSRASHGAHIATQPRRGALQYNLDGTAASYANFDRYTLDKVNLTAGQVAIFRIDP